MALLTSLLFKIAYYGATIGYPAYQAYVANKQNKQERIWVLYFFIFGIFTILESTLLWPVKALVSLVCACVWCWIKFLFSVWLQHPNYRGALFIEQAFGKFFDLGHSIAYPIVGKVLTILGFPDRSQSGETGKKTE